MIPVFGSPQASMAATEPEEYCNERFLFCLSYPEDYFDEITFADNGDGITLSAQNSRVEVSALGAFNVMNWTPESIIESYFKVMKEKPMEVKLLEMHSDNSNGWAKMKYNHEIQLFRVDLHPEENIYTTTIFRIPASSPELLEQLLASVQVTYNAPSVAANDKE